MIFSFILVMYVTHFISFQGASAWFLYQFSEKKTRTDHHIQVTSNVILLVLTKCYLYTCTLVIHPLFKIIPLCMTFIICVTWNFWEEVKVFSFSSKVKFSVHILFHCKQLTWKYIQWYNKNTQWTVYMWLWRLTIILHPCKSIGYHFYFLMSAKWLPH